MKGRQGGTRFDCPKLKKKSRKLKARDAFFSELVRFWEERRAPSCSVQRGGQMGAFKTEKPIFFVENEYAGTAQTTEWVNQSTMIMVFIV